MNETTEKYCVIMAGGIGSRFWPWSTKEYPKQFLDILGTGKSLIQQTYERFSNIIPPENFLVVTNQSYSNLVLEQLPQLKPAQVLGEPVMRNTAPCIAYASYKIKNVNPNAQIIVTPSDHLVLNQPEFQKVVMQGFESCANGGIITLGISPSRPDTGYGYIEYEPESESTAKSVIQFKEKPSLEIAKSYVDKGNYVWNAGIFIFNASYITQEFENHLPEMANIFSAGNGLYNTPEECSFIAKNFPKAENISIDYGIMEKSKDIKTIICDFGWSDLGTWRSVYENLDKDDDQNATLGKQIILNESKGNLVKSLPNKTTVIQGVNNVVVVDTEDALLICHKTDEQKIKQLVQKMSELKT